MIVIDTPRPVRFRRFQRTAHCASTLKGDEGTRELLAFALRVGLREDWLQHRGTPREHFDLFDAAIERAIAAGAVQVTPREFVARVVLPKRELQR
jgi:hypothetical protein